MPMFRFMAPVSPFLAVLLGLCLERLPRTTRIAAASGAIVFAVLPLFGHSAVPSSVREALYFREFKVGYQSEWERWETTVSNTDRNTWRGFALKSVLKGGEVWTGGAIGATGFYSDILILDRNGLVNREVAMRDVEPGSGTAGHEKRVPRAWFRNEQPTYYKIFISPMPISPQGESFDAAVQQLIKLLFIAEPAEQELVDCSVVEIIPINNIDPLPPQSSLIMLKHVKNPGRARAFWSRYTEKTTQ